MGAAPNDRKIDIQEAAAVVTSGQVEAEEQPTPADESRPGNHYSRKQADREQPRRGSPPAAGPRPRGGGATAPPEG